MLRVVALRKAAIAGAAGALAWELVLRPGILAGVPLFDIVRSLGTLAVPHGSPLAWWPLGMAAHVAVGIAWTVFYAYFFWGRLHARPAVQGLVFAALPALLAALLVVPQVGLMHLGVDVATFDWAMLSATWTPWNVVGLVLGHALFGLTMGAIYTHPVGYPAAGKYRPALGKPPVHRASETRRAGPFSFMFATGIECSYPTIENGRWRRDELASTGHYLRWAEDFALARQIGVSHIRYGPPLHLVFTGPDRYDWSIIDDPMEDLRAAGPEPIVDLCHFGVPTWLGNFQNPDIARALGAYAGAFATRYPWVRFYTPANEMYVCTRNSALDGLWNEQRRDERSFVTAVVNLAEASNAMTDAILAVRKDAVFVNSESSEFCQPCCPDPHVEQVARFENERRFLPLDLIYAHEVSPEMRGYLRDQGMSDEQYLAFMRREVPRRSIIGLDYYEWNERLIDRDGHAKALGELFGWSVIARQYWDRYRRTLMHTETNRLDAADAPRWLWRQWHNVQLMRSTGVPLVGFTWYSLADQVDWNSGVTEAIGAIHPVGLFDLNRDPRGVGLSYKYLIDMFADQPDYRECRALMELAA